ncbi:MAG: hypothetical protein N3E36_05285 [Sulfolobales archaeon]|nr:hypothetical protein [Sulfolobales archaeon]
MSNEEKAFFLDLLNAAIDFYNMTRSPEASARLIHIEVGKNDGVAVVEFSGEFCTSCGVRDWVEDLVYVIKSMGYDAELLKYIEPNNGVELRRIGIFKVRL